MSKELVVKRLQNALKMNLYNQIRTIFPSIHPENQAELLEKIDVEDRKKLIYILGDRIKPHLLIKLPSKIRYEILGYLNESQLANIVMKLISKNSVIEELELDIKLQENQKDSVLNTILNSVRQRTFWLIMSIFLMAISSLIVDKFEDILQKFTIISVIVPVISNIASSTEAQSCTILVRDLGRVENLIKDWKQIIFKETSIGFISGFILALLVSLILFLWKRSYKLSIYALISVFLIQGFSCFTAAVITLGTQKLKLDPALVSDMVATGIVVAFSYYVLIKFGVLFL